MGEFIFFLMFVLWLISGGYSFIYWWTSDYDLTTDQAPVILILALGGPFTFLMGWCIHGTKNPKVLIKRRGNDEEA